MYSKGRSNAGAYILQYAVLLILLTPISARCQDGALISPGYAVPVRPLLHVLEGPAPLTIASYLVQQDGTTLTEAAPTIRDGLPLHIYADVTRQASGPGDLYLAAQVMGAGPLFEESIRLDSEEWPLGATRIESLVLPLPRLRYGGDAVLRLVARSITANAETDSVLSLLPIHIDPEPVPSRIPSNRIHDAFGPAATPVGYTVRLGPNAAAIFPLEGMVWTRLAVVSRLIYSQRFRQGEPVCRIDVLEQSETVATLYLRAGVSTAVGDHDFYAPDSMNVQKIDAFDSWPADRTNPMGQTYQEHLYAGVLVCDGPLQGDRLRITYLKETGLLEIAELALLPPKSSP